MTKQQSSFLLIAIALIGMAAAYGAWQCRFTNLPVAHVYDAMTSSAIAVMNLFIAKINLVRTPQNQNLAIFCGVFAGFCFAAAIDFIHLAVK